MFTGIVEEMGVVKEMTRSLAGARVTFLASLIMDDLTVGASVSVNGACVTVVELGAGEFSVNLSSETLSVTTMGVLTHGAPVNLERAMKLNQRIGGHMVSGHVDAVGSIRDRRQEGETLLLVIEAPSEILRYCVLKGSITVDGISLTINQLTDRSFGVSIIPHTAKITTLGLKQIGETVNLESDLIGKYVERLLQERGQLSSKPAPVIDKDYLKKRGLL